MLELRAAVGGRDQPPPDAAQNERVYTVEQIVRALGLRKDGAVYHGPEGCEIDSMYSSRSELEVALGDGAVGNHELVTDPDRTVGVEVYRPSAACVRELERRLAALVAR